MAIGAKRLDCFAAARKDGGGWPVALDCHRDGQAAHFLDERDEISYYTVEILIQCRERDMSICTGGMLYAVIVMLMLSNAVLYLPVHIDRTESICINEKDLLGRLRRIILWKVVLQERSQ